MIRAGRDDDAAGFIGLIGACWAEYPSMVFDVNAELPELHTLATYMAGRGGALWAAEQGGAVVGMAATYPAPEGWHVARLYVTASQRGTGLARRLLATAEDYARAAGAGRIVLWSDSLFVRAHAFYEKHGYVRRGGLRSLQDLSNSIEFGYAKPLAGLAVEALDIAAAESAERALAGILIGSVGDGSSVGFMPPLARDKALGYWREITRGVGQRSVVLLAAWLEGALVGTVQLGLAMPDNQPHRGDIRKLLVAPKARRRGVGRALMAAAEEAARQAGRRLLVLDTLAGGEAEPLYRSLGWVEAGTIPDYALDVGGAGHATRYFYKRV